MSKSLKETEKLASDIQLGKDTYLKPTGLKEVNSIRESLMELNARLRLKQKTRKSLVDQLVHQTRTPLTILRSHIEAIEDGVIEVNKKELQVCQNQISDLTSIISNMSSMIDADRDTDEMQIESFDFGNMLKQIQQGLAAQFRNKKIGLEIISDQSVNLVTDKYKLSQAIYNIVTNAYKYTKENGNVRISYITVDDRLIVKIQDTGMGISENEKEKIFRAYYRSPNGSEEKGDGIGLYIVKENIQRIHGGIEVESKLGVGSTFIVNIPLKIEKE
jgi:signal transduction histidine kinase